MKSIRELGAVDWAAFRDIRRLAEPVVLRGLVQDWPLVRAAQDGRTADYLRDVSSEAPLPFMRAPPEVEGRLHYAKEAEGRNFSQGRASLAAFLDLLAAEAKRPSAGSLAIQGLPASELGAEFVGRHPMRLLPAAVPPRLWIGNAGKVAIHHDPAENIACVAAGGRHFTLFPPEAVGDLYMGPFHQTPAGVQVSLVHLTKPDLERFPRFARALTVSQSATLEPGDALYIPYQWYHHVEALGSLNVLVNYWWDPALEGFGSPWDALMHGLMSLRPLPPDQRRAWRAMFDHYVFQLDGEAGAHLPAAAKGVLAPPSPAIAERMRRNLREKLGPS